MQQDRQKNRGEERNKDRIREESGLKVQQDRQKNRGEQRQIKRGVERQNRGETNKDRRGEENLSGDQVSVTHQPRPTAA